MSSPEKALTSKYDYFGSKFYEKYVDDPDMLMFAERTNQVINDYLEARGVADPSELSQDDRAELEQILASKTWKFGGDK